MKELNEKIASLEDELKILKTRQIKIQSEELIKKKLSEINEKWSEIKIVTNCKVDKKSNPYTNIIMGNGIENGKITIPYPVSQEFNIKLKELIENYYGNESESEITKLIEENKKLKKENENLVKENEKINTINKDFDSSFKYINNMSWYKKLKFVLNI